MDIQIDPGRRNSTVRVRPFHSWMPPSRLVAMLPSAISRGDATA
jgi:hypothetical protein